MEPGIKWYFLQRTKATVSKRLHQVLAGECTSILTSTSCYVEKCQGSVTFLGPNLKLIIRLLLSLHLLQRSWSTSCFVVFSSGEGDIYTSPQLKVLPCRWLPLKTGVVIVWFATEPWWSLCPTKVRSGFSCSSKP